MLFTNNVELLYDVWDQSVLATIDISVNAIQEYFITSFSSTDGFKQHIKNMFNKFSSYWFTYIYIYMNPITLSTRNVYYF